MDLRDLIFRIRGTTPIPFLLAGLIWAKPNTVLIVIGGFLCLCGELLRINSLRHAGGATRTRNVGAPSLVSSGPYGHVRNPLYLANMLLYIGFALGSGALMPWLPIAALLYFTFQYGMIISLEEESLKTLFGPEYAVYCDRVPRLWPRLTSGGEASAARYSMGEALREERSTISGLLISWAALTVRMRFIHIVQ